MSLVVETGSGLRASNSYVTTSYVDAYLAVRQRSEENNWSTATTAQKEAAVIAATQYIDARWGRRFLGERATTYRGRAAQAILAFSGVPLADDTVTVGTQTYVWKSSLTTLSLDQVVLGANAAECTANLIAAINGNSTSAGTSFSELLQSNDGVSAALVEGETDQILLTAQYDGASGNEVVLTESSTNLDVSVAFAGGLDHAPQALEFPRRWLYYSNGTLAIGIPEPLRQATSEYAVRAHSAQLFQDPTVDATGRVVTRKREVIGPIEEETEYAEGSALSSLIRPYPAADNLLRELVGPAGRTSRA